MIEEAEDITNGNLIMNLTIELGALGNLGYPDYVAVLKGVAKARESNGRWIIKYQNPYRQARNFTSFFLEKYE